MFIRTLSLLLLFWAVLASSASADRQLVDRVIAVVNNEVITQSELDIMLRPVYQQYKQEYAGEKLIQVVNEARQKLLNQLIEDRLVFQKAEEMGLEVPSTSIEKRLDEFRRQFPNQETMEEALLQEGMVLQDMRERVRRQEMIRLLHDIEVRSKVIVSPREIEDYYKAHRGDYIASERLKVRSLTIKKDDEAREKGIMDEAAKRKITGLRGRILEGEDFAGLAREHSEDMQASQDGLSNWVGRGSMIPVIDNIIFALEVGELSEIVETPMGYHLFRVKERRQKENRGLEDVRDEIYATLFQQKMQVRFEEWMEELKREAYISVR